MKVDYYRITEPSDSRIDPPAEIIRLLVVSGYFARLPEEVDVDCLGTI